MAAKQVGHDLPGGFLVCSPFHAVDERAEFEQGLKLTRGDAVREAFLEDRCEEGDAGRSPA